MRFVEKQLASNLETAAYGNRADFDGNIFVGEWIMADVNDPHIAFPAMPVMVYLPICSGVDINCLYYLQRSWGS